MKTVRRILITLSAVGIFIAMNSVENNFLAAEKRFKTKTDSQFLTRVIKLANRNTTCAETPAPSEWPPSQQDVWKPVIANSDVIFVFSAFLTPKHTVVIPAMMRDFETRPRFFCQFWSKTGEAGTSVTVENASLALSGETHGRR